MAGDHVHPIGYIMPDSVLGILTNAAIMFEQEITRPSSIMRPQLVHDEENNQWKAIYWSICGIGSTPNEAFRDFDIKWKNGK